VKTETRFSIFLFVGIVCIITFWWLHITTWVCPDCGETWRTRGGLLPFQRDHSVCIECGGGPLRKM